MIGYKGISRNSAGAVLGTCTMRLFLASTDALLQTVTSDASGNYYFSIGTAGPHYITAYKSGSPDVVGSTVRTLEPVAFDLGSPQVLSISDATGTEGGNIVHTITVLNVAAQPGTFAINLADVTATGGVDYTNTITDPMFSGGVTYSAGYITVPAGASPFTMTIPVLTDAATESSETYTLTVGGVSGTGTIAPPAVSLRYASALNARCNYFSEATATRKKLMMRIKVVIGTNDFSSLRLMFQSTYLQSAGDNAIGNNYYIESCAFEKETGGAAFTPVTFSSARTVTVVDSAGGVLSDAILPSSFGLGNFTRGHVYWVRALLSVTGDTHRFPNGGTIGTGGHAFFHDPYSSGVSATDSTGALAYSAGTSGSGPSDFSFGYSVSPLVLGTPVTGTGKYISTLGDSIVEGAGDTAAGSGHIYGFAARSLFAADFTSNVRAGCKFGRSGSTAAGVWTGPLTETKAMLAYGNVSVEEWGTNGPVYADSAVIWAYLKSIGQYVIRTKLLTSTTSSDGWATTANQTKAVNYTTPTGDRVVFNNAVAAQEGILYDTFVSFDSAVLHTDRDLWKAPGYTTDGLHPAAAGHEAMAAVMRSIYAALPETGTLALPALGSLTARWSVDALTPVADGTAVSSWTDSVSGLPAVQGVGGKQPLYKTNRLNGKPSLLFSGGQLMTAGTPAAIITPMVDKVITIMAVFKGVTTTTYGAVYSASSALSGSWLLYADATRVGRYNGANLSTTAPHSGSEFTSITFTMEDTTAFSSGTRQERLYINGGCVGASHSVPDGQNDSIGFGGRASDGGLNLKGEVFEYIFWNRALTPAEVATAHAWACNKYGQATPWAATSKFYAFHGDSETMGTGTTAPEDTYPYKVAASLGLTYGQWSNLGVGGLTINNMTAKAPTQVDPLATVTGKTLVVPCFEYYNSKAAAPAPANQMITYLQARRAAGCKLVFGTSMDSFLANATDRGNYNSYWATNYATYTDAYAAIHTNANIGIAGACSASQPSTYFTDTTGHPTAAGYTVLAGLMTTACQALP